MGDEDLQDKQSEVDDIRKALAEVGEHLDCAESCETGADFVVNIEDAIKALDRIRRDLVELKGAA